MRLSPVRVIAPSSSATPQIHVHVGAFTMGPCISFLIPTDASKDAALFCLVCSNNVLLPRDNYVGRQVFNVGTIRARPQLRSRRPIAARNLDIFVTSYASVELCSAAATAVEIG